MREIKFRAYDKTNKEMMHDVVVVGSHVIFEYERGGYDLDELELTYLDVLDGDNEYEIMQYTGLKDKNGTEIYEGDIVEHKDYSSGAIIWGGSQPKSLSVIKWSNYYNGYHINGLGHPFKGEDLEIIGNIYNNPEPLEESK